MENHNYLINIVLVILISGVILTFVGNYLLDKFSKSNTLNLKTCDEKLLEEANNRMGNNGNNGYTLTYTGYIVTGMGLLFLIILSTFFSVDNKQGQGENIKNVITGSLPVFLSLIVVSYILLLNVKFKERLIEGKVADEYFSYLSFFSIMFMIQIITLSKYIKTLGKSQNQAGSVVYALALVNILIIGIMNIILSFFSTDG